MSGDARDFNNIETRAIIKCIVLRGLYVEQIPSFAAVACFLNGQYLPLHKVITGR